MHVKQNSIKSQKYYNNRKKKKTVMQCQKRALPRQYIRLKHKVQCSLTCTNKTAERTKKPITARKQCMKTVARVEADENKIEKEIALNFFHLWLLLLF